MITIYFQTPFGVPVGADQFDALEDVAVAVIADPVGDHWIVDVANTGALACRRCFGSCDHERMVGRILRRKGLLDDDTDEGEAWPRTRRGDELRRPPRTDAGSNVEPIERREPRSEREREFEMSRDETATAAVIGAVAAVCDADPLDLPPLNDVIPCDEFDAIVDDGDGVVVTISYEGFRITVCGDGRLVVRDAE